MHFLAFSRSSRWPSCRRFLISPRHVECAKRATPSITPHMLRRKIDPAMSPMDMRRLIYLSFWKNAVCARISKVTLLRFHSPYAPRQDSKLYTSLTSLLQIYNVSDQVMFMSFAWLRRFQGNLNTQNYFKCDFKSSKMNITSMIHNCST